MEKFRNRLETVLADGEAEMAAQWYAAFQVRHFLMQIIMDSNDRHLMASFALEIASLWNRACLAHLQRVHAAPP